jgi:hypothetical protein
LNPYRSKCNACGFFTFIAWEMNGDYVCCTCLHCGDKSIVSKTFNEMATLAREIDAGVAALALVVPRLDGLKKPGDRIAVEVSD